MFGIYRGVVEVSKYTEPLLLLFAVSRDNGLNLYFFGVLIYAREDSLLFWWCITRKGHEIIVRKILIHFDFVLITTKRHQRPPLTTM